MIKIEAVTAYRYAIPLRQPFRISTGEVREKHGILFSARSGDHVGWGEASVDAVPFYTSETVETALHIARQVLVPLLKSRSWDGPDGFDQAAEAYRGHRFTKAAFECLLWDVLGKMRGEPVWRMLGGVRDVVECGPSIGIKDSPEQLVKAVGEQVSAGAKRIKVKVAPGRDEAFLQAVREAFPGMVLMADANAAYTPEDIARIVGWDRFNLLMVEQPLAEEDLYYHAELARTMTTPVCLDESITTGHVCRCALAMKAADIVNIKVGRVGGLSATKRIHDMCQAAGVPVWIGGRISSGIAESARLAAASLPGATLPSDAGFASAYLTGDIVTPPLAVQGGNAMAIPDQPGLGVEVDRDLLEPYLISEDML